MHHKDGEHRRSIEHGALVNVRTIVKHCRNIPADLSEGVFTDNGEGYAGRACVFLSAAIYEGILADVHSSGKNVG